MSPTPPSRDPTRTAAETTGKEAQPPGDASTDARAADAATATADPAATATDGPAPATTDGSAGTAAGVTRRGLVRSIGAGAALLGGSTALSGVAAGQSSEPGEVQIEGVEDWELATERVDQSEIPDGPTVAFEDDAIVVTGGHVFQRTGCYTFAPRRLVHSTATSRLGVIVDAVSTNTEAPQDDPQVCAEALEPQRYELRVTTEQHTSDVVVEEAFTDDGRSHHPRIDDGGIDPPAEVADYEFTFGPEVGPDDAAVLTPSDADAMEPSVTFDGDDVVVEGAMTYGSSSCNEIALDHVQRRYEVEGHVEVDLDAQRRDTVMPGEACTADVAADWYRLELTGSGEPPIERCSVGENPPNEVQSVMVEEDDDLELPEGVLDHRLELDRSGDAADREDDPTVSFEVGEEAHTVVVEGTMVSGSSSCNTLAVGDLVLETDEAERHLLARVDRTERENDLEACTDDGVTMDYRLELTLDRLPETVTAEEGDGVQDEVLRSVTVDLYGDGPELPEGVLEYALSVEPGADAEDVHADPNVTATESADPSQVTVDGALTVSACYSTAVTDVRWVDDAQSHLAVTVTTVDDAGTPVTPDDCPLEALPEQTYYTLELAVESLPDVVTAEERIDADGEPARTATVDLGSNTGCADADTETVDGQTVCSVGDDGYYRDVTGDGSVGQGDVAEFFGKQHREAWKRPELFDFSGNGDVTHGDVVELADHVALN